ncbi:hypothetical protein F3J38_13655 [Pantoea sp. Acro-805]|uniref:Uncharacterized protein n=1 Tax=Candidatus Pantoea formicae TaxID=2608355 RepID=A0ABX0QVP1_9GAMM|nr:hypothetical protein [Pantoea formicae]MDF7647055.1 hypothetical protein [Erwiniaceae bacterium L1_54_3]NIF01099.1 hypothetical protein [Pantoea formicae]
MKDLNNLIKSLEKIISELNASGKVKSAIFFTIRYDEIMKYGDKVSSETIEALSTCRAMSQYANFSQKEEMLLDDVVDNAIVVKNKAP